MTRTEMAARFILELALFAVAVVAVIMAQSFQPLSVYAPTFAGSLMALFLLIALVRETRRYARSRSGQLQGNLSRSIEHTSTEPFGAAEMRNALRYVAWIVIFVVMVTLLGMYITTGVFLAGFLLIEARRSIVFVVGTVVAALAILWLFGHYVQLIYPLGSLTGM